MTDSIERMGLTPEQDAYLRTGLLSDGEKFCEVPAITEALRELLADRPPEPDEARERDGSELYAMPAATATLLEDRYADIGRWLAEELSDTFAVQLGSRPFTPDGDVKVLRDPYSAKPYVLFYCTCKLTMENSDA